MIDNLLIAQYDVIFPSRVIPRSGKGYFEFYNVIWLVFLCSFQVFCHYYFNWIFTCQNTGFLSLQQFLKEILNELCVYNKRGTNQGTYELKPEYKKSVEDTTAE